MTAEFYELPLPRAGIYIDYRKWVIEMILLHGMH